MLKWLGVSISVFASARAEFFESEPCSLDHRLATVSAPVTRGRNGTLLITFLNGGKSFSFGISSMSFLGSRQVGMWRAAQVLSWAEPSLEWSATCPKWPMLVKCAHCALNRGLDVSFVLPDRNQNAFNSTLLWFKGRTSGLNLYLANCVHHRLNLKLEHCNF